MADLELSFFQGPTSKEKKYDRQLRLWGATGQAALENAHLLLINSGPGAVGVETLKNLVLPGIGKFTIVDPAIVSEEDLGVNFFLEEENLGGFRAEHTCNHLNELNPDVQGNYIAEPVESLLRRPNALEPYTFFIVVAPVSPEVLATLSSHALNFEIPLFYVHCVGFLTSFRIQLPSAWLIIDTHPDPATLFDLRLISPWLGLQKLARQKTEELVSMPDHDHGHVPWALLLIHYLEEWKTGHDGQVPQNYQEKTAFRNMVTKGARTNNPAGGEENFEEAVAAVLKALNPPVPSSTTREIFDAPECQNITATSPNIWLVANAISTFYKNNGTLPLPGNVPDMKARSDDYIQLQNIYKAKAREDFAEVLANVRELEKTLGRTTEIDEKNIEVFCKGAGHVRLVRGRPFQIPRPGEKVVWGDCASSIATSLLMPDSLTTLHIAFLAYDIFCASNGLRAPGIDNADADSEKLTGIVTKIINDLLAEAGQIIDEPENSEIKEKALQYAQEISRAGGSELHNIASLLGGVVSQEAIKAITKQYIPADNTCLFDGVASKSGVIRI